MSQVKITAVNGQVFTPNTKLGKDGKQYGFIRIESKVVDMSGAVARVKTLSALKSISQDDYNKAKGILTEGTQLPGKIIVKETTEAGLPGYQPKMAGSFDDSVPYLISGAQIYRTTEYTSDINASDVLVAHDNIEDVLSADKRNFSNFQEKDNGTSVDFLPAELKNKWASDIFLTIGRYGLKLKGGKDIKVTDFKNLTSFIEDRLVASQQLYDFLDGKNLINRGFCPFTNEKIDNSFPNYNFMGRKIYFSQNGFKQLKKESGENFERIMGRPKPQTKSGCYIATVCYGDEFAPEVVTLKKYRDENLSKSVIGRILIKFYYTFSPSVSEKLKNMPALNNLIKERLLDRIVKRLER